MKFRQTVFIDRSIYRNERRRIARAKVASPDLEELFRGDTGEETEDEEYLYQESRDQHQAIYLCTLIFKRMLLCPLTISEALW